MIRENFVEELKENLNFPRSDFIEMSQCRPFYPTTKEAVCINEANEPNHYASSGHKSANGSAA